MYIDAVKFSGNAHTLLISPEYIEIAKLDVFREFDPDKDITANKGARDLFAKPLQLEQASSLAMPRTDKCSQFIDTNDDLTMVRVKKGTEGNKHAYDPGFFGKFKDEKIYDPGINAGSLQEVATTLEKFPGLKRSHASTIYAQLNSFESDKNAKRDNLKESFNYKELLDLCDKEHETEQTDIVSLILSAKVIAQLKKGIGDCLKFNECGASNLEWLDNCLFFESKFVNLLHARDKLTDRLTENCQYKYKAGTSPFMGHYQLDVALSHYVSQFDPGGKPIYTSVQDEYTKEQLGEESTDIEQDKSVRAFSQGRVWKVKSKCILQPRRISQPK